MGKSGCHYHSNQDMIGDWCMVCSRGMPPPPQGKPDRLDGKTVAVLSGMGGAGAGNSVSVQPTEEGCYVHLAARPGIGSPAVQAELPPPEKVEWSLHPDSTAAKSCPAWGSNGRCSQCGDAWAQGLVEGFCPFCAEKARGGNIGEQQAQAIKDSGVRVEHSTGAVRDSAAGRGRPDLISPIFMERLALHLERGAAKYAERNWEKGLPVCRMFASLMRHTWLAFQGSRDEDHLAAVACNAMFILHTLEMIARNRLPASLDDRPDYSPLGEPDSHLNDADAYAVAAMRADANPGKPPACRGCALGLADDNAHVGCARGSRQP